MIAKRGWFDSLQTTSRVPSAASVVQNDSLKEGIEVDKLPEYNSALVYCITSVHHGLPSGFKCLQVHTLLRETITLAVHTKCKVRDVFLCCCSHLKMKESWLLGLASRIPSEGFGSEQPRHEYYFLDPYCKLAKYGPKNWRLNYPWSTRTEGRPFLVLHLRVRIYVSDAHIIRCPIVLNYYYLQLRENLLDQWSTPETVSEERCWKMASVAYEADSFTREKLDTGEAVKSSSFRPERYFPLWVINVRGLDYVRRNLRNIESGQISRSKEQAIQDFCEQASSSPFPLNCHLYGLRQYKVDTVDNAFVGITPNGLEVSDLGDDGGRNLRRTLHWADIVLLSFDKRKLKVEGPNGSSTYLYAHSEEKARYLFEFCRTVHQAIIRINQYFYFRKEEIESAKEPLFLSPEVLPTELLLLRQSPVSRGSINSTSGVVSDKPNSEADKDFDWTTSGSAAELLSSNNVSPKSYGEQTELDLPLKNGEVELKQNCPCCRDDASGLSATEECFSRTSLDKIVDTSLPKPLTVDTNVGKIMPSLGDALFTANSLTLDSVTEKTCPKPPPIDTSVGRSEAGTQISEPLEGEDVYTMHLNQKINLSAFSEAGSSSPHTLIADGEIVEDDVNLGVSFLFADFPHTEESVYADNVVTPPRSALEATEVPPEASTIGRRLRPSSSVNIGSLFGLGVKQSDDTCTWHSRAEILHEKIHRDFGIKRPPVYAEAVASNRNFASNGRTPTNTKGHAKQRWKTVAGVTSTMDMNSSERNQQFHYLQAQARSEPKLDLPLVSTSASPPAALHLSMQQLPITSLQQLPIHAAGFAGKFQKQSRCLTRFPRSQNPNGINRVQSMPAHPAPLIQIYDVGGTDSTSVLHHAHSLAVRPLSAENKQPPSYEHAIQQARARYVQKTNSRTSLHTGEQSISAQQMTFGSSKKSNDSSLNDYPFMSLLLREHQQENMDLLTLNNGVRQQPPKALSCQPPSQYCGEISSSTNEERLSESSSTEIRDMRNSVLSSSSGLSGTRSHHLPNTDLFNDVMYSDEGSFLQYTELYRGGCHAGPPVIFRQYAPYLAEQQAGHASWNPIPPPPPYPQTRSSTSALEAPMVM